MKTKHTFLIINHSITLPKKHAFVKLILTVGGPDIDGLNVKTSLEIIMHDRETAVNEKGSQRHWVRN